MRAGRVGIVLCGSELVEADAYVVAMGSFSTGLLNDFIAIPVYPLKGFSITAPIVDEACAPISTVLDETYKFAKTRFDNRIRVGGMAEIVGYDRKLRRARRETLEMCMNDLFPGGGDTANATFWTGLRPMTPDGTPIVRPTYVPNLYINMGYGTLGWTMSCGSGQLHADLMSGRTPEIKSDDLPAFRYLYQNRAEYEVTLA